VKAPHHFFLYYDTCPNVVSMRGAFTVPPAVPREP
jgi:hypothetical protein